MISQLPTNAQWFQELGKCVCGKPATGKLMSDRNATLGSYCKRCAERAIKLAHRKGKFLPDCELTT